MPTQCCTTFFLNQVKGLKHAEGFFFKASRCSRVSMPEAGTLCRQTPSWFLTKSRILKRASKRFQGHQA